MTEPALDAPAPALFQSERQREIVKLAVRSGRVEVADLADRFGVTTETIRRDLSELQEGHILRRVHGGAIPWEPVDFEPLLSVRTDLHDDEKRRLALAALDELPESGAVIIDSGSTTLRFAEAIPRDRALRIVTNSLPAAGVLADRDEIDVIVVGGKLRKNTLAMVDADAIASIERLSVDTLFMSADGFTAERGLSTPYREEALLKQAMVKAARRVVVLVDRSKAGQEHFIRFAGWPDVDVLVTNTGVDEATIASIEATGTTVSLA